MALVLIVNWNSKYFLSFILPGIIVELLLADKFLKFMFQFIHRFKLHIRNMLSVVENMMLFVGGTYLAYESSHD